MFKVGQKVVCVDASGARELCGVEKGCIYVVSGIVTGMNDYGILLSGVETPAGHDGFRPSRFRPVQETGMEMLRAIPIHPNAPVRGDT